MMIKHLSIALLFCFITTPVWAFNAASSEYIQCLQQAEAAPRETITSALDWAYDGGGLEAQHCLAVAQMFAGEFGQAALRFEHVIEKLSTRNNRANKATLIDMYLEGAEAWVQVRQYSRAERLLTRALASWGDTPDLIFRRAQVRLQAKDYWQALDDLHHLTDLGADTSEVIRSRAHAYRQLDTLDLAQGEIEQALAANGEDAKAWLEQGYIFAASGEKQKARDAFLQASLLAPRSPTADEAQMQFLLLLP